MVQFQSSLRMRAAHLEATVKTITLPICDRCGAAIMDHGWVLQGTLTQLPSAKDNERQIPPTLARFDSETALHGICLVRLLGIEPPMRIPDSIKSDLVMR